VIFIPRAGWKFFTGRIRPLLENSETEHFVLHSKRPSLATHVSCTCTRNVVVVEQSCSAVDTVFNKLMTFVVLIQSISEIIPRAISLHMNKVLIEILGKLRIKFQIVTAVE
jgi:hypothetical protein